MLKEDFQVLHTYTRAQAIADGDQVDVSEMAREAGFKFSVYLTRRVWDTYIVPDERARKSSGQSENGRLWDTLWMLRFAIRKLSRDRDTVYYRLYFIMKGKQRRLITLKAVVGARDIDDPSPAITIMVPDED